MSPFYFFLFAAVALLAVELAVFQLSVFWFLFAGLAAMLTAAVCWFQPETSWTMAIGLFALMTVAVVAVLFPVLRRFQTSGGAMAGNDAVGQRVQVLEAMQPGQTARVSWSGRDWDARLLNESEAVAVGEEAVIESVEGIRLTVRRA